MTARIIAIAFLAAAVGCGADTREADVGAVHAVAERPSAREDDLGRVVVPADAAERIGIQSATIERRAFPRARTLGGEIIVPTRLPGSDVLVPGVAPPDRLHAVDVLLAADEAVQRARIDVEAAAEALARAVRVQKAGAGSVRSVEEARARLAAGQATLRAAEVRRQGLVSATLGAGGTLWARVPVYVGDLGIIAADRPATVTTFSSPGGEGRRATPVNGPQAGNPDTATVDLFYAVAGGEPPLRPGEKVLVTVELHDAEDTLVVPWRAVVYDAHGGEWVYEREAPDTFVRRRVQVRYVIGSDAALASGPPPGATVVVAGAAELFGFEFGFWIGTEG